jgi:tetratricopeptide (TPR) repeat protein
MDRHELLERYEALGDEEDFLAAKPLYEQAVAAAPDAQLLLDYGYLLESHARNELRRALEHFERALELDPDADQARYQLIGVQAALLDTEEMIALQEERAAASPGDVREYRFLACAYLRAHAYEKAREAVDTGLGLAPDDRTLIASRGEVRAGTGDPDGALADWRRALELDGDDIGPLYSSAFVLEREGRLDQAAEAWRSIIEWNESRGYTLPTEWPKRELERLRRERGRS